MTTKRNDTLVPLVLAPLTDGRPRTVKEVAAETGLPPGKVYEVLWRGSPWVVEVPPVDARRGRWWVLSDAGRQLVDAHTTPTEGP